MSSPSENNDESFPAKETRVRKWMIVSLVTFKTHFSFVTFLLLFVQVMQAAEFSPEDRHVRLIFFSLLHVSLPLALNLVFLLNRFSTTSLHYSHQFYVLLL